MNRVPGIGDVYWIDLTAVTSHSEHLVRSWHMVVVVQDPRLVKSPLRICLPITSATPDKLDSNGKPRFPTHYLLRKQDYPFLKTDSIVKCEQIITIEWRRYLLPENYIGTINKGDLQEIVTKSATAMGLKHVFSRRRRK